MYISSFFLIFFNDDSQLLFKAAKHVLMFHELLQGKRLLCHHYWRITCIMIIFYRTSIFKMKIHHLMNKLHLQTSFMESFRMRSDFTVFQIVLIYFFVFWKKMSLSSSSRSVSHLFNRKMTSSWSKLTIPFRESFTCSKIGII